MRRRVTRSIVPNLLTLANLFSGFTAIVNISDGRFTRAAMFILLAAIFDMLDGLVARLLNSTSEFGEQLDSLCDAVSFGLAPAYMLYAVYFKEFGESGIFFASLPALSGVTRLARFNVESAGIEDKRYFRGLPIPSAALTIVSYIIFYHNSELVGQFGEIAIFGITLIASYAMVSNIRYDSLPKPTIRNVRRKPVFFLFLIVGIIASVVTAGDAIFPVMMIYVLFFAAKHFILWLKETINPEDEIDESTDSGKSTFEI